MNKKTKITLFCLICLLAGVLIELDRLYLFHTILRLPVPKFTVEAGARVAHGKFDLWVGRRQCATTGISYILPVDTLGRPCPKGIVFYAPFLGENGAQDGFLPSWLKPLASRYGYLVFSIATHNTVQDLSRLDYYVHPESGWFGIVLRVARHLQCQFGLEKVPLKIIGQSAGGIMAQRMHSLFPERISSVAWVGGNSYFNYQAPGSGRVLGISVWGDDGENATKNIVDQALSCGYNAVFAGVPPVFYPTVGAVDHHSGWDMPYSMLVDFIAENPLWKNHLNPDIPEYLPKDEVLRIFPLESCEAQLWIFCEPEDLEFNEESVRNLIWEAYNKKMCVLFYAGIDFEVLRRAGIPDLPIYVLSDCEISDFPAYALRLADARVTFWHDAVMNLKP